MMHMFLDMLIASIAVTLSLVMNFCVQCCQYE
jgi:hypothetical protein